MIDGPFTDDMVRQLVKTAQTHEAIREYGEAMAEFLAEAAVASEKARGDSARWALDQWLDVIKTRAIELIDEKQRIQRRAISAPDVVEGRVNE